jgi:outer membrane protein assembly factor BamD
MRRVLLPFFAVALFTVGCGGGPPQVAPNAVRLRLSSTEIDSLWTSALVFYEKRDWRKAGTALERVQLEMPTTDSRAILARFYLAESRLGEKSNLQAVREFRRVSDEFPNDTLAPVALLRAADSYLALWRRPELDPTYGQTAYATYQELLARYPASPAAKTATERLKDLDNRFAWKEYKAALFYVRIKAWDSAILYLRNIVATWPRAEIVPEALTKLVEAYRTLRYVEDTNETCTYFRRQWPDAPKINETCPLPKEPTPPPGETTKGP